jgi:L-2-hydroxyglutarate oxidase LhgO
MDTNFYDIIIIGTGIAGLFSAYNIKNTSPETSFLVLEKYKKEWIGGRSTNEMFHGASVVTGAGVGRKDKDKLHPIKIRFTEDRKSIYINVGWSISQKDWSNSKKRLKSTHKEHLEINYEIEKILKQYEKQIEKTGQVKRSKIMVFNFIKELIRRKTDENKFSTRYIKGA